jgi:hypothetical protein
MRRFCLFGAGFSVLLMFINLDINNGLIRYFIVHIKI